MFGHNFNLERAESKSIDGCFVCLLGVRVGIDRTRELDKGTAGTSESH